LGYRLDQHGNPINILEERKEAIKSAVLHVLTTCSSDQSFPEELLKKGITLKLSKEDREIVDKKIYRVLRYEDGKGKSISARELGPEFMASSVSKKIKENAQVAQDRESIAKSKIIYETDMAKNFAGHKGSATAFSKYLKSLQPDDIEEISKRLGQEYGKIGVEYIQHRLQADINKSDIQLAGGRDKLRREGYDVGKDRNKGLKM